MKIYTRLCVISLYGKSVILIEKGVLRISAVLPQAFILEHTENDFPRVTWKYQMNSLYNYHYSFKTTSTGDLNIYMFVENKLHLP